MSQTSPSQDQDPWFQSDRGPERLQITATTDPGHALVVLNGELDLETAPVLDQELTTLGDSGLPRLVIDLRGVEFMDSAGLASIYRAHRRADGNGHTLVLRRGSRQVQRILELTGLLHVLTFED